MLDADGRDEWFDVAGARLHVRRFGAGSGSPLLFVNGLGANPRCGAARLAPGRSRDSRLRSAWHGSLDADARPLRMPGLARLVGRLLDDLRLPVVDVLGYSLGGVLAQELALSAPHRVRRLVLAATTPGLPSRGPSPWMLRMLLDRRRFSDRATAERTLPLLAGGLTARDPELVSESVARRLADPPSRMALRAAARGGGLERAAAPAPVGRADTRHPRR